MNNKWTDELTELARANYRRDVSPAEFLRLVGRTKLQARRRFDYLDKPEARERQVARHAQLAADRKRFDKPIPEKNIAPPEVLAEAIQRAKVPRTLTAILCGDPAPGFSALERRT